MFRETERLVSRAASTVELRDLIAAFNIPYEEDEDTYNWYAPFWKVLTSVRKIRSDEENTTEQTKAVTQFRRARKAIVRFYKDHQIDFALNELRKWRNLDEEGKYLRMSFFPRGQQGSAIDDVYFTPVMNWYDVAQYVPQFPASNNFIRHREEYPLLGFINYYANTAEWSIDDNPVTFVPFSTTPHTEHAPQFPLSGRRRFELSFDGIGPDWTLLRRGYRAGSTASPHGADPAIALVIHDLNEHNRVEAYSQVPSENDAGVLSHTVRAIAPPTYDLYADSNRQSYCPSVSEVSSETVSDIDTGRLSYEASEGPSTSVEESPMERNANPRVPITLENMDEADLAEFFNHIESSVSIVRGPDRANEFFDRVDDFLTGHTDTIYDEHGEHEVIPGEFPEYHIPEFLGEAQGGEWAPLPNYSQVSSVSSGSVGMFTPPSTADATPPSYCPTVASPSDFSIATELAVGQTLKLVARELNDVANDTRDLSDLRATRHRRRVVSVSSTMLFMAICIGLVNTVTPCASAKPSANQYVNRMVADIPLTTDHMQTMETGPLAPVTLTTDDMRPRVRISRGLTDERQVGIVNQQHNDRFEDNRRMAINVQEVLTNFVNNDGTYTALQLRTQAILAQAQFDTLQKRAELEMHGYDTPVKQGTLLIIFLIVVIVALIGAALCLAARQCIKVHNRRLIDLKFGKTASVNDRVLSYNRAYNYGSTPLVECTRT